MIEQPQSSRVDRWLWFARFFKSRTKATEAVASGTVEINGRVAIKPKTEIKPGDELRLVLNERERVIKVVAIGVRRGPATEAQTLYEDHTPAPEAEPEAPLFQAPHRDRGAGRPTKRDRRALDRLRQDEH